jgi:hypothetical protein
MEKFFFRIEIVSKRDILISVTADTESQAKARATVGPIENRIKKEGVTVLFDDTTESETCNKEVVCSKEKATINPEFMQAGKNERLAAGRYLVIDPCYVFGKPRELWSRICNELKEGPDRDARDPLIMTVDNNKVFIFSTAYGDGCYPVSQDEEVIGECGVDAGLLSFIPEKLITSLNHKREDLGTWVDIDMDSIIEWQSIPGNVQIDNVYVDTNYV